jgi:hypothetical protein
LLLRENSGPETEWGPKAARLRNEVLGGDRRDAFTLPPRSCPAGMKCPLGR